MKKKYEKQKQKHQSGKALVPAHKGLRRSLLLDFSRICESPLYLFSRSNYSQQPFLPLKVFCYGGKVKGQPGLSCIGWGHMCFRLSWMEGVYQLGCSLALHDSGQLCLRSLSSFPCALYRLSSPQNTPLLLPSPVEKEMVGSGCVISLRGTCILREELKRILLVQGKS